MSTDRDEAEAGPSSRAFSTRSHRRRIGHLTSHLRWQHTTPVQRSGSHAPEGYGPDTGPRSGRVTGTGRSFSDTAVGCVMAIGVRAHPSRR
jgi:hypothetical protein